MSFMGVGPAELVVILVIALIFVGPDRLPRLAADLARMIREVRKYTGSVAAEFNEVIKDFEKDTEGERSEWKDIGEGLAGASRSVTEALRGVREDIDAADAPAPSVNGNGHAPEVPADGSAEQNGAAPREPVEERP